MPTAIANLWTPDVWVQGMREKMATFPSLFNSPAVVKDPELDAIASGPGTSANVPFFKDITDQADAVQAESTAPTTDNVNTAGLMVAPILNCECKNSVGALSGVVSGSKPVDNTIVQMVDRRLKQRQTSLANILRGIFATSGATGLAGALSSMVVDKFTEDGTNAQSDNLLGADYFIDAKALLGEVSDSLEGGCLFAHSQIIAGLEKQDLNAFKEKSLGAFTVRTYRGVPIFKSDALVRAGSTSGYVYDTYLITPGSIGWGEKPQAEDQFDTAHLAMEWIKSTNVMVIYDRTRFLLHPNGIKWVGTPGGQSASNAELATRTNWQLAASSAARCGMVCIRTNG